MTQPKCGGCGANVSRGSICESCAQCECGSGKPPGLCHRVAMTRRALIARFREQEMTTPQIVKRLSISRQRLHQIEHGYGNE
jgi:hypothetical protein